MGAGCIADLQNLESCITVPLSLWSNNSPSPTAWGAAILFSDSVGLTLLDNLSSVTDLFRSA